MASNPAPTSGGGRSFQQERQQLQHSQRDSKREELLNQVAEKIQQELEAEMFKLVTTAMSETCTE